MVHAVRFPPPGCPLPGSGQLHLLIRSWVGTTGLPFVLFTKMPLARHCRALSWISNEEAGKAATSSHINRLSGRGGGGGGSHYAHSVNMHAEKTSGGAADSRERKGGREMSIKDPGRAEISIVRRTSKINCWEKMQTKCFCCGERQRIRTGCSHLNSLKMLHFYQNCCQEPAAIGLSSETPTFQLAGSAAPERTTMHARFGLSEPVTGALSTGDVYKWDL